MTTEIATITDYDYENAISDLQALPAINIVARMRIAQPQSALVANKEADAGSWYIDGMDTAMLPSPMVVQPKRVKFVRKYWEEGNLECQSIGGFEGVGNPGGDCESCQLKEWQESEKPVCVAGLATTLEVVGLGLIVDFEFHGSALRSGNLLVAHWKSQVDSGVMDCRFELGVSKRDSPAGGIYYLPTVKLLG